MKMGENMSNTDPMVWSLQDITQSIDESSSQSRYFVQIPKFQRSIVWTDSQIKKLVDSIYKGFPIGSLLAYQTDQSRKNKIVLQLVDGLQRVTAISRFMSSPLRYAPIESLVSQEVLELCSTTVLGNAEDKSRGIMEQRFRGWFDNTTELKYGETFNFNSLARHLSHDNDEAMSKLIVLNSKSGFGDSLLGQVLQDQEHARNYKVPINVYAGPIENVPTIFERINSQGAKLSKYEILAASWSHTTVDVTNVKVLDAIAEKYRVMIANGYEVEGFDEDSVETSEYNLYEYLFGLGKVLATEFPTLFHSSADSDDDSPVAFQIFTVALQLPVAKMGELPKRMPRLDSDVIDVDRFERAVLQACQMAEKSLSQYLELTLNEQTVGPSGVSQNQAISLVTSILANCFDERFTNFDNKLADQIAVNFPAHFLLDTLRNSWGNAGDSTLFDRTWQEVETSAPKDKSRRPDFNPGSYYLKKVEADSMRTAFGMWHSTQLEARQKERARYSKDMKPVLKFIYSTLVSSQEDKGVKFELEHVYPVAVLKKLIIKSRIDGLPLGAIGNLMLLPKDINRIKKENLLGDYLFGGDNPKVSEHELDQLQKFLIVPKLQDVSINSGITPQKFYAFCEQRSNAMVEHLIKVLKLN
jgi:hypothetical protein